MDIGPPEWIIIAVVLLLVFGSSKIPQLARNLGRAQSELKKGLAEGRDGMSNGDGDAVPGDDVAIDTPQAPAEPSTNAE